MKLSLEAEKQFERFQDNYHGPKTQKGGADFLSYLAGIYQLEGGDVINKDCIVYAKTFQNDKTNVNLPVIFAHWLENMIVSNFLFQPTLSRMGMKQAEMLGKDFLDVQQGPKNYFYDAVICSATVRTMMTAYISLLHTKENHELNTIHVVPYINESENDAVEVFKGVKGFYDFSNAAIHPGQIEKIASIIKSTLDAYYIPLLKDKIFDRTKLMKFNTDLYKDEWNARKETNVNVQIQSIDKFWGFFTPALKDASGLLYNKKRFLAITHGYAIKEVRKLLNDNLEKPNFAKDDANTSTYRMIFMPQEMDLQKRYKKVGLLYFPLQVRGVAKELLPEDVYDPEDEIMLLNKSSLRGKIAEITHMNKIDLNIVSNRLAEIKKAIETTVLTLNTPSSEDLTIGGGKRKVKSVRKKRATKKTKRGHLTKRKTVKRNTVKRKSSQRRRQ